MWPSLTTGTVINHKIINSLSYIVWSYSDTLFYTIAGDGAYPVSNHRITLLSAEGILTRAQRKYNQVTSSAIERTNAHLKGWQRRLHDLFCIDIDHCCQLIMVGSVVHNLCILSDDDIEKLLDNDAEDDQCPPVYVNQAVGMQRWNAMVRYLEQFMGWGCIYMDEPCKQNERIPQCLCPRAHNAPFQNRSVHISIPNGVLSNMGNKGIVGLMRLVDSSVRIEQSHKSQNAPVPYPTLHHFFSKWCIVEYGTGAFWDLWMRSINLSNQHLIVCIWNELHICINKVNLACSLEFVVCLVQPILRK